MTQQADTQQTTITRAEEQQAMLAAIVNTSDDTIVSKTLDGMITSWNKAAERMFGYTSDEAIGKHISLVIPPSRIQEEEFIIGQIKAGEKVNHFETVRVGKSGQEIPVSLSVSPIRDAAGNIIGASKIARDISAQLEAQEQIMALNRKKDEFVGLASHELKTPLTSLSGYLQILSRVNMDDHNQKYIDKSLRQVAKLTALVNGLLDVSRIETGRLQLMISRFDLKKTILDAINTAGETTGKHQIMLETSLSKCKINADSQRIEQVIDNLLANAIKYSPHGGKIDVTLSLDDKVAKISVRDHGIGIAQNQLGEVFSRFYRVADAPAYISGLGIGLYLSQEIIRRHAGTMWAESELGKGSMFWITLPLG
jgi:PAS domain S-box-containing protein